MTPLISNASHWQARAAEMRALAATIPGDEAKATILRMAQHYEELAARAGATAEGPRPSVQQIGWPFATGGVGL